MDSKMNLEKIIPKIRYLMSMVNFIDYFPKDPLSKNSIILLTTWCMNAAVGFVFILFGARMYPIDSVGIAFLLISYTGIIILVTRLGIDQSMIRFYSEDEKNSIFCSSLLVTSIATALLGGILIVISFLGFFGSFVLFTYSIAFIIGLTILSVSGFVGTFFLASGKPVLYLLQNAIIGSRILFLFLLVPFGVLGIFLALIVAAGFSIAFSVILLMRQGVKFQITGWKFLQNSFHYSMGNYFSDFFLTAPLFLIPIIVFFLSGEKETAIYSVGFGIASIALLIPNAIGYAVFISGCQGKHEIRPIKKIILPTLVVLVSLIIILFFWGRDIVGILGPEYSGALDLILTIMSASIFALFFQIYSARLKIKREIKNLLILNFAFFFSMVCLSIIFIIKFGLIGTGYAWILSYAICMLPIWLYEIWKKKRFPFMWQKRDNANMN